MSPAEPSAFDLLRGGPFARTMLTNVFFFASLNGFALLPLYVHSLGGDEAVVGMVQGMSTRRSPRC